MVEFSSLINLILGIIFIYFLLSIICTIVLEIFSNLVNLRAKCLENWVRDIFNKDSRERKNLEQLGNAILMHPLVDGLTPKGRKASYIPKKEFVLALFDVIVNKNKPDDPGPYNIASLKEALEKTELLPVELKRNILQMLFESEQNLETFRKSIENWFDSAMERITGGYKRKSQRIILVIAVAVAISTNTDSVSLIKFFYKNPKVAAQMAQAAEIAAKDSILYNEQINIENNIKILDNNDTANIVKRDSLIQRFSLLKSIEKSDSIYNIVASTAIPIGWDTKTIYDKTKIRYKSIIVILRPGETIITKIIGLLLTALAITLGAPFWFDVINKLANIRSAGRKPEIDANKV
jgi:hypothetical protein